LNVSERSPTARARGVDLQQAVTDRQILDVHLEVDQDLEQRDGWTLGALDDTPAAKVPASRRPQRSVTRKGEMVADPPEEHLRRHALVNAVQQLLDEARACFCGGELQGAATLELALGRTEPMPGASAVSEDLFPERGDTSEAYGSVRFRPAQGLVPRATMRQRASGDDQRADLVAGQT
jgi:hypothetical protein